MLSERRKSFPDNDGDQTRQVELDKPEIIREAKFFIGGEMTSISITRVTENNYVITRLQGGIEIINTFGKEVKAMKFYNRFVDKLSNETGLTYTI